MIAAVGSVLITPWNWYSNDQAIHYTLDLLGSLIGPLFGILIAGYFVVAHQRIAVDDLFTMDPSGRYWYRNGFNPNAVKAIILAGIPAIARAILPSPLAQAGIVNLTALSNFSWFIGAGLGFAVFTLLERRHPYIVQLDADDPDVNDGNSRDSEAAR